MSLKSTLLPSSGKIEKVLFKSLYCRDLNSPAWCIMLSELTLIQKHSFLSIARRLNVCFYVFFAIPLY
uniref:Uncharacterized protein n=1 Tax=Anguilla anguilla TaxID=7936 RepID=A0A0E9SZP2_ANGAN